jgi:hypothetical protein
VNVDVTATLAVVIPLVAVSLGLTLWAIVDLFSASRVVVGGNKLLWLVVILISTPLGALLYFLLGRRDG